MGLEGYRVTLGNIRELPRSMNSGLCFLLVLRGALHLEINGEGCQAARGDIVVLNHTDLFSARGQSSNVTLLVNLSQDYLSTACPEATAHRFLCNSAGASEEARPLYASIQKNVAQMGFIYAKKDAGYELLFQAKLFEVLHELVLRFRAGEGATLPAEKEAGRIASVLSFVHQNHKNRISLAQVAEREYMSVQYLSRLFRQKTGTTFTQYLAQLRLDSAVQDLVYTKDTVTKIALNNGFASAKAFTEQFAGRYYGISPQEYRRTHARAPQAAGPGANIQLPAAGGRASLDELVRFIEGGDQRREEHAHVSATVDVANAATKPLARCCVIVDIGDVRLALRADTRSQLAAVQKNLRVEYLYFRGFVRGAGAPLFQAYDFQEAFSLFSQTGLVPFVRLDLDALAGWPAPGDAFAALAQLLQGLRRSHPPEYFEQWMFEAVGTPAQLRALYPGLAAAIHRVHAGLRVGLRVEVGGRQWEDTLHLLCQTQPVCFLTLAPDPNLETAPSDAAAYEAFHKNYHTGMVQRLSGWAAAAGLPDMPLYMPEWNTLTGTSVAEAGEFHRTALVADVLTRLSPHVAGVGVKLSLFSMGQTPDGLITHNLSLFVYRGIRRPMFFVYRAFASLKPGLLYGDGNMLVTTDGADRYACLLYNPCYINPFQSLDNLRRDASVRSFRLTLSGLAPGRYRIKKFLMDKDNGSLYHSWVKLDFTVPLDEEDIDEYLENVSNPSVLLGEAEVEGSYTLQETLSMNATALYIIKKMG